VVPTMRDGIDTATHSVGDVNSVPKKYAPSLIVINPSTPGNGAKPITTDGGNMATLLAVGKRHDLAG
jgi:hypothetical protein